MEAAPKLPMLSFELKSCTETVHFGPQLKKYIAAFYGEDPDSYTTEINKLESLRAGAVRPSMDVNGVQLLKKYYCQLHFLKSRFPMEHGQDAAVQFGWKNSQLNLSYAATDIRFELMVIMFNIGALHSYLGASDTRNNPDGMKMACTHFQCAAWAFQTVKEKYHQFIMYVSLVELIHFFQQVCLAQAQECILEKSMFDNRKPTIIAKVAVQVYSYYRQSLRILESVSEEFFRDKAYIEWTKYLQFKLAYYRCIALLFQGQQAEEQQKMGERVSFYQAACEQLEEAKKHASTLKNQHQQQEINEGLAFTTDVVEGKRKAAKNENEFIYHESVPDKEQLQEVKGASLVKGIPFSINDAEVSGPDIFSRLVPMEAHEAASLYSEKKAQMLRQVGELIEAKDQSLAEMMSSMQLEFLTKMRSATGIPQELIERCAALAAKPAAVQDLINAMGKLSNIYQEVEANLNEIDALLKAEEEAEKLYQEHIGKRPPSILATDLTRETAKYREAHTKANDSNQTLHRAMTAHVANLKILQQPLKQLQHQLPFVEFPNPNIDENSLIELETLVAKVEEMRNQRSMLWAQLRESVHQDDITSSLVTKQPNQSLEQLFQQELQKHQQLISLIEQNTAAQENIKKALMDAFTKAETSRKYVHDIVQKRTTTVSSLVTSCDTYDDLLSKANKGIEFYTKLETNVSKLLQRIRSTCKVQQEERDQVLSTTDVSKWEGSSINAAPKLKDYLDSRKKNTAPVVNPYPDPNIQYQQPAVSYPTTELPPGVRPTPVGSEVTDLPKGGPKDPQHYMTYNYNYQQPTVPTSSVAQNIDEEIIKKMNALLPNTKIEIPYPNYSQYSYSNYNPQTYTQSSFQPSNQTYSSTQSEISSPYDPAKAYTTTTNSYRSAQSSAATGYVNYPNTNLTGTTPAVNYPNNYQYQNVAETSSTTGAPGAQNVNTYYPQGYAPNQNVSNVNGSQHVTGQVKYHSVEYATSVQPNQIPYNGSTYSSPNSNMSSTHSNNTLNQNYTNSNYGYYYNANAAGGTGVAADTSKIGQQYDNPQANQTGTYYPAGSYYANNAYGVAGQTYSTAAGNMQMYSQVNPNQPSNSPTPGTYNPNSNVPGSYNSNSNVSGTYNPNSGTYNSIHNASGAYNSNPNVSGTYTTNTNASETYNPNQNVSGTYNSNLTPSGSYSLNPNVSGTHNPNPNVSGTVNQNYNQYYPSTNTALPPLQSVSSTSLPNQTAQQQYYTPGVEVPQKSLSDTSFPEQPAPAATPNYGYASYYGQNYPVSNEPAQPNYNYTAAATSQVQPSQSQPVNTPVTTKSSNVDLLSGLDFNISQAPLVPQQNVITPKQKEAESKQTPTSEVKPVTTQVPVTNQSKKPAPEVKRPSVKILPSKPLNNRDVKNLFNQELERYEKFVETLTHKTLSGPTTLEIKWKEIQDQQDCESQKKIISVARCYPMKNRFPDILPYDYSRVELCDSKDDYINASYIKDVSLYTPSFIVTQVPLSSTVGELWTMVREQQVELILCLLNDNEIGDDVYWPKEKGQSINILNTVISLQSVIVKSHWTERLLSVSLPEKRESRVVMHLQFTSWPGSLFPTSSDPFVSYILESISMYQQQKSNTHPVVVHCSSGIGRSGLVCLLTAAIFDVSNNANSVPDLTALSIKLSNCRKNILRDREHLKFGYECFLAYMKHVVSEDKLRKKLNELDPTVEVKVESVPVIPEKNIDPLSTLDPFWASKK